MKSAVLAGVVLLALLVPVFTAGPDEPVGESIPEPEVRLYKDGRLTLDGKPITLKKIIKSFEEFRIDEVPGIHYFMEDFSGEEHPDGPRILKFALEHRLRVTIFEDEDLKINIGILIPG